MSSTCTYCGARNDDDTPPCGRELRLLRAIRAVRDANNAVTG